MMELIKLIFKNLPGYENGYSCLIDTLKQVGVDKETVETIESEIFKQFKLKSYQFVADQIE